MMKNYNIIWIDDSDDFIEGKKDLIKDDLDFVNVDISVYSSFDSFYENELCNYDEYMFSKYDLILVDYNLQSSQSGSKEKNGIDIIKEIRCKEIYTDIIFYSNQIEKYVKELKSIYEKPNTINILDGIHYADRDNLVEQINIVYNKNMKRELSVRNIRGSIMDCTAEFDSIIICFLKENYIKLSNDDKKIIIDLVKSLLKEQNDLLNKSYHDVIKLTDEKMFMKSLDSIDALLKVIDKYHIFNDVCKLLGIGEFNYCEYKDSIIKYRNKLAHKKITMCDKYKKLLIGNHKCNNECNQGIKCNNDNILDIDCINNLHNKIKFYYNILLDISSKDINV